MNTPLPDSDVPMTSKQKMSAGVARGAAGAKDLLAKVLTALSLNPPPPPADDDPEGLPKSEVVEAKYRLIFVLIACVLSFFVWSAWAPLDVASYAQGQVIPAGQLKRIQHLEGGIVEDIKVREGEMVQEGQVILELQTTSIEAEVGDLRTRLAASEIQAIRLQATLNRAASVKFPAALVRDFPKFVEEALSEFKSDAARYNAAVATYRSRIASRQAEIQEARERLKGLRARSVLIEEQVAISSNLLERKLTSEYEHLQLLRDQSQVRSDRDTAIATEERAKRQMEEEQASLVSFKSDEEVKLRKALQEVQTELAAMRERFRKPEDSQKRTVVRAPVAGTVQALYFKNRGAVVSPGGLVATLVPEGEALLIEAKLPLGDVGFVRLGERTRLSLASGARGYGSIDGEVVYISPDSFMDEKTGQGHYIVRIRPEELAFKNDGELYPLRPGVQVTCAILTGTRSVLALITDPFLNNGVQPLTER